jgi:hypothetical protein
MIGFAFLYKTIQNSRKLEKIAANDGEGNDFSIKCWKLSLQTILIIQGGDGGMEYAMCTLMLGNGTEGIMAQQHMSWDTLVSAYFSVK